jgi:hypothetical protein
VARCGPRPPLRAGRAVRQVKAAALCGPTEKTAHRPACSRRSLLWPSDGDRTAHRADRLGQSGHDRPSDGNPSRTSPASSALARWRLWRPTSPAGEAARRRRAAGEGRRAAPRRRPPLPFLFPLHQKTSLHTRGGCVASFPL